MIKSKQSWDYSKYIHVETSLQLSQQAVQYFKTLDNNIKNSKSANLGVPEGILSGFKKLSKDQKIKYITENLQYLSEISHSNKKKIFLNGNQNQEKQIIVKCLKDGFFCISKKIKTIKLETQRRVVIINDTENINMIKLQNYIVHAQKGMFSSIIFFQPIVETSNSWNNIRRYQFSFDNKQFNLIYESIYQTVMEIRNQELVSLFNTPRQKGVLASEIVEAGAGLPKKLINRKQYSQFSIYKNQILSQKGISYLNFNEKIYEQLKKENGLTILRRSNDPKLFKAQIFGNQHIYDLKQRFLQLLEQSKKKNELIIQSEVLQTYSQSILNCVALFEKYYLNKTPFSTIYMRQILSLTDLLMANSLKSIISIEEKKRFDDFVFYKSIDSPLTNNFFTYLCFFVDNHPNNKNYSSQIVIIGEFCIGNKFTLEMVKQFLAQFYYSLFQIEKKSKVDLKKRQSFKTGNSVSGTNKKLKQAIQLEDNIKESQSKKSGQQSNQQLVLQFAEPQSGPKLRRSRFISQKQVQRENSLVPYLKHKFKLSPIQGYKIKDNKAKDSFMKGEWVRSQEGGLICTNQKLLSEHKKIYKHILATIGSNLLKGGNILNVSLPVTIFKKQGHLQMIADSFSSAPIMLQGVKDPLQRIKRSIVVSIGVGTLSISAQKPFFPTLGQTLQVWIGGCPMYMQQILRYPPTGAYLFYGRGYKIYGQVEPKISIGLSGAKGYSQRPSYIEFDDNQKIQLSYGKLVISGLFVGDRQFNFYDKSFAYDKKNNIFAEIIYGARDTQIFGKNKQEKDFVYGKIYEVTGQFRKKFDQSESPKPFPNKKYIERVLSQFEGYWNGAIKFDNKAYFDFTHDLPCRVDPEQFCLPSDTRLRKDLMNLIEGNIDEAQQQKEFIEQTQRRDRKLRGEKKK